VRNDDTTIASILYLKVFTPSASLAVSSSRMAVR
jgi:hypothetical protein